MKKFSYFRYFLVLLGKGLIGLTLVAWAIFSAYKYYENVLNR